MKASEVIVRAQDILQDAGAHYWPQAELLRWLSDGRLVAYAVRPDLYERSETLALIEGTRQTLPGGSRWLFGVMRNVSHIRQRAITVVDAVALARVRPNWRSMPKALEIKHYLYDERCPAQFDVYPPARDGVEVEISYALAPMAVSALDDDLSQEGVHAPALVDFVCFRAFLKEADTVPAFQQRAMQHLQLAQAALGANIDTKLATSPNSE